MLFWKIITKIVVFARVSAKCSQTYLLSEKSVADICIKKSKRAPQFEKILYFLNTSNNLAKLFVFCEAFSMPRNRFLGYKESILPAYVAWRAGTTILFLLGSHPQQTVLKFQHRTANIFSMASFPPPLQSKIDGKERVPGDLRLLSLIFPTLGKLITLLC
jgi:hypothetical protein